MRGVSHDLFESSSNPKVVEKHPEDDPGENVLQLSLNRSTLLRSTRCVRSGPLLKMKTTHVDGVQVVKYCCF
jgi:hypothetical protein